ncbi:MAG: family phosphatase [Segetibacter sp.]|nr:family phosphatase [Segetibacter sp.]
MKTKAYIFDLNGTMVDDMEYHIEAWYKILKELKPGITWDRVKEECYGKNHELLERVLPGKFSYEEKDEMSWDKEKAYQEAFRPQLKLIDGLDVFLKEAYEQKIKMAIASAAIRFNVDFVINGTHTAKYFNAIVSADDVETSKPDPTTFLVAAEKLGVTADESIVFEDTPKGVEAAANANMKAVVIKTLHNENDFKEYDNILRFADDYNELMDMLKSKQL